MPGVEKKLLIYDPEARTESYLLRLAPGARLPRHAHDKLEECMMIEGEAMIGDLRLVAGDYHAIKPGQDHPEVVTETGALAYIRGEVREAA